jgi:hypothetical protein
MTVVIGYGSLMIAESLAKTIPAREMRPVWVPGYRRIFNLKTRFPRMYKVSESSNKVAVLNVVPEVDASTSALAFDVSDDELEKLKLRERIYYMKEVKILDFKSKEPAGTAVMFIGRKMFHGERIVSEHYLPVPSYLDRCREACYKVGKRFGKTFDSTTFVGDGRTVAEYLKENI